MKELFAALLVAIIGVIGLTVFLSPNDLVLCDDTPSKKDTCQKVDAIVAVSGGDTKARAGEAIKLYKNGWANKIVFSGAAYDKSGPSNARVMKLQALSKGVPESAIAIDEASANTRQNAEQTVSILKNSGVNSMILVTSGYHQRRASLEFSKRLGDSIAIKNHPVAADNQWSKLWWLTPTGWYLAGSEFIKIIGFYASGQ